MLPSYTTVFFPTHMAVLQFRSPE